MCALELTRLHISHRPIQIAMDLERPLVQPPVQRRAKLHWKKLLKTFSGWIWKTLKNRDPTISLRNLLQCLITRRTNIFLNIQSQIPVSAYVHYLTMNLGEEADSVVLITDRLPIGTGRLLFGALEPPLIEGEQAHNPWPLLTGQVRQPWPSQYPFAELAQGSQCLSCTDTESGCSI